MIAVQVVAALTTRYPLFETLPHQPSSVYTGQRADGRFDERAVQLY